MSKSCSFCNLASVPVENVSYQLIVEAYVQITNLFKLKTNIGKYYYHIADNFPNVYF